MSIIFQKIKNSPKISGGILILILISSFVIFGGDKDLPYEFIVVEKKDIIQEVRVTGRVKPSESVDLAFENTGRVAWINVDVGDTVFIGQALLGLSSGGVLAQLAQAKAHVKVQKAQYDELVRGTRDEEIVVQEIKVTNAETSYEDTLKNLVDKINDAYTKSDDAIRNKVDQFFSNPKGSNPQLDFTISDNQLESNIESTRVLIEITLISWKAEQDILTIHSNLQENIDTSEEHLNSIKNFLNDIAFVVNALRSTTGLTQTTINNYKADVATARTNVNTAISNLLTADEKLRAAQSTLLLEQQELVLKRAGATNEEIVAQEARVEEVTANVQRYEADVAKMIIYSPLNGIVTKKDIQIGEIVGANIHIISLTSNSQFEVEVNVPEVDVTKLSLGNSAEITLDAYGSSVLFEAAVVFIDPAETIIDGVPTYKTKLQFIQLDSRIRSGMTANIDILTNERFGVIAIPARAVIIDDKEKKVRVIAKDGEIEYRSVVTGLRGSDGAIEIVDGISEGDKVIIFINEE